MTARNVLVWCHGCGKLGTAVAAPVSAARSVRGDVEVVLRYLGSTRAAEHNPTGYPAGTIRPTPEAARAAFERILAELRP